MDSPVIPFIPADEFTPEPDVVIDDHPESPLRKRARHHSLTIDASEPARSHVMVSEEPKDPVRDDTYYMSDGSCVLRVQNTLFNV
jgi:hypothetical protein